MGSVSSTSFGLSNLLQTLSTESPVLSSVLSSPGVQSALEKEPPTDLVALSHDAAQLQEVSLLFGSEDGTQTAATDPLFSVLPSGGPATASDSILQAWESSLAAEASGAASGSTGSTGTASSSPSASVSAPSSPADQTATAASNLQAQELATLFGTAPSIEPSLNLLG